MYAGINGLVFFGIVILAHPFDGAAAISPAALEIVYVPNVVLPR